jgi:RNA polymerase nonessential primary-like sigma factor
VADYLVDPGSSSPEDVLIKRESNDLVAEAMSHLSDQERKVICHRFGILSGPALTLKEIGEMMCISRERVRQIECQAKNRLRKHFARKLLSKASAKRPYPSAGAVASERSSAH